MHRESGKSRVLLLGEASLAERVQKTLEDANLDVFGDKDTLLDALALRSTRAILLLVDLPSRSRILERLHSLRVSLAESFVPLIVLVGSEDDAHTAEFLDAGADLVLAGDLNAQVFLAQLQAFERIRQSQERLQFRANESRELNLRLQQVYEQIEEEAELAHRIHKRFLPVSLPEMPGVRFGLSHRPRTRGGDFFNVIRLDEDHAAFFLGDSMNRGITASNLLTILLLTSLVTKEIVGRSYRLIPPEEVLQHLHGELCSLEREEPIFMSMLFAQINLRDGEVVFARAGQPLPIHLPTNAAPTIWSASGSFLGIQQGPYSGYKGQLRVGDKLLLYSDGACDAHSAEGSERILSTAAVYAELPIQSCLDHLAQDLFDQQQMTDDFTILGLEFGPHS